MKHRTSKFDLWIDRLAARNLEKGIKPALAAMITLLALSVIVIYYGTSIEYKTKSTALPSKTIKLFDLLFDSEQN